MRGTEKHNVWMFDLAHGNLSDRDILRGFLKHYVLGESEIGQVQDDIHFHTFYGREGVKRAKEDLLRVLWDTVKGGENEWKDSI